MLVDFDVRGQRGMDFFTGGSIIIMDIMAGLKLKLFNDGFVSHKHAAFYFTKC